MRDPGSGDGPSSRSKKTRKDAAKSANDDAAPRNASRGASGEGVSAGKKKSGARSAKKAAAADIANLTTAAPGATSAGTTGAASNTGVTPGDAQAHDPAEFKAVSPDMTSRTEEIPIIVAREDVTIEREGDDVEIRIRRRAYEIYLSRRGAPGDPIADWIAAEREVRSDRR
jgi:hypothetical protein